MCGSENVKRTKGGSCAGKASAGVSRNPNRIGHRVFMNMRLEYNTRSKRTELELSTHAAVDTELARVVCALAWSSLFPARRSRARRQGGRRPSGRFSRGVQVLCG